MEYSNNLTVKPTVLATADRKGNILLLLADHSSGSVARKIKVAKHTRVEGAASQPAY